MVEPIMIFAIGFLAAAICGLLLLPLVHNRAVRLTRKRLEAAAPLSMAELQADKDQLRAEHAMATRRLELLIEHLKSENASQFADLGKKADAINLFKLELDAKVTEIDAHKLNIVQLQEQLIASQDELTSKVGSLNETERLLTDKQAEIGKILGDLNERDLAADSQRVEIIALHAQVEALKNQINELRIQINASQMLEADLRTRLSAAKQDAGSGWADEQAENAELRERINAIAAEIAHLTMAMEGPHSPIEKLLASSNALSSSANGGNGGAAKPTAAEPQTTTASASARQPGTLSDRIRALQTRTPRQSTSG